MKQFIILHPAKTVKQGGSGDFFKVFLENFQIVLSKTEVIYTHIFIASGFLSGSVVKNPPENVRDTARDICFDP